MSERIIDGQRIDPNQVGEGPLTPEQHIYKENILEHYRKPRNKRVISSPTVQLADKNPLCGDLIEIFLTIDDGFVTDVSFQGTGCAISQASASMLTELVKGMAVEDALALGQKDVLELLGIPIGIVRMKCAMLSLRVLQRALDSVEKVT